MVTQGLQNVSAQNKQTDHSISDDYKQWSFFNCVGVSLS